MKTPPTTSHPVGRRPRYPRAPTVRVEISKEIFEQSKRADSSHCMIAEAIKLAIPQASKISVDLQTIRFSDAERRLRYVYLTPRIAQIGIIEFDQGHDIEPFNFRLSGAHILPMHEPPMKTIRGIITTAEGPRGTTVIVPRSRVEKMNLAKQGLRVTNDGRVPERVGGKAPPSVPFSRRRAFGLRAIQK